MRLLINKKKLVELSTKKPYKITALKQTDTKFGKRSVITIDNKFKVFLSPRLRTHFDENPIEFKQMQIQTENGELFVMYHGKRKLEFQFGSEFPEDKSA